MPRVRLFIAIATPPDPRRRVAAIRDELRATGADVRWEPEGKLHCTVKFLGDTDDSRIADVIAAVRQSVAGIPPFVVRYTRLGCFPNRRDPRIIWAGMDNADGALARLQQQIEDACAAVGYEREDRAFHPHVTLGRVKGRRNLEQLLALMEKLTFDTGPATIADVELAKSDLQPSGSVYTTLNTVPLSP
jgi:RNA 2',3'-cyclic 3'-phosphodiesterase